ncbi:squalene/phytoene synthase family protein [Streptomyces sp. NPDC048527]|uniref:squalene/phytoene synthase family protein n=1 Tax=Streptomyces sp. NPDC048527 TaxID=3365568 RepID=UPI003712BCA3
MRPKFFQRPVPSGVLSDSKISTLPISASARSDASSVFCREMLARTSRTFALNVPLLPRPLDDIVAAAYLLCRVADALEDEAAVPTNVRAELLGELAALVALPQEWRELSAAFADRACGVLDGGAAADQVRLVAGLPILLEDLAGRSRPVRELVLTCVQDMTAGMARTMLRREAEHDRWSMPDDVDEVLGYCDIVASTVGRILTGLFAWHSGGVAAVLPALEPRAAALSRVLQLTNILKDVRADLDSGRCWLPRSVLADHGIHSPEQLGDPALATRARGVLRHMIAATHRELTEAVAYIEALPTSDAAIRQFCVAPLLMAVLTLRKLWDSQDVFGTRPVKISRRAVKATLLVTRASAARPAALGTAFVVLRRSLPGPLPPHGALESPSAAEPERTVDEAVAAAAIRLAAAQSPSGSWHEDYGGVPYFLALYVLTCYTVGVMPDETTCARMEHHFRVHQNPDGGWGLDTESPSVALSSVLGYTAMRLLGVPANDPSLRRARDWVLRHGGALAIPHWGKLFLAVLGVYEWKGLYPFVPEIWLLPQRLPFHPGRLWCYPRLVHTSMSWLYARRAVMDGDPLLGELRTELYPARYEDIDWVKARAVIATTDAYRPRTRILKTVFALLSLYEAHPWPALRTRAMEAALDRIDHENRSSHYVGHGPIPKVLDTLVWHFARPGGEEVAAHIKRLPDYLWDATDGARVQCFNSSETWDTSFAVQALAKSRHPGVRDALHAASGFLERNQRLTEVPDARRYFRHPGRGGWPLSTGEQGWSITDGTAEALKALLALDELGLADEITPERRLAAIEYLLSTQNRDGGWPTYEQARGPAWLEKLNFSDVFDNLMIDYSSIEPTASCVTALRRYRTRYPDGPRQAIDRAIERREGYLLDSQRADGSWEGFWGVCFTYGTWFGIKGLAESRDPRATAAIDRGCEFLLAHQRDDGGWGELLDGYRNRRYVHAETSQAVMTSWALLALVDAGRAASPAAHRATAFLIRAQRPHGTWEDQHLSGSFMRNVAMNYDAYQRVFPLWALSAVANALTPSAQSDKPS